jgi:hypothetical protein
MALKMLDVPFATKGDDHIIAFLKRGDQSRFGARNLQPVGYILPSQWQANHGFLPQISEFNGEAFVVALLPKTQLDTLRAAIAANGDSMAAGAAERVILDDSILTTETKELVNSPTLITPVDCTKATTVLKSVTLETAEEQFIRDFKVAVPGTYTYGSGGTYALLSNAIADLPATLDGNFILNASSARTENATAAIASAMAGNNLTIDGMHTLATLSLNASYITLAGSGAGKIIIRNKRVLRDATAQSTGRAVIYNTTGTDYDLDVYNIRADGASIENTNFFRPATASVLFRVWNCIVSRFAGNGFVMSSSKAGSLVENCVICTCGTGVVNGSRVLTYRNNFFCNNTANISTTANCTTVNCATDAAAVGGNTDTAPQVNAVIADELINTTITDLVDGYRLKSTSTKLKSNGAAPEIVANTSDIFGRARPDGAAGYSIGVSERAIPTITGVTPATGPIAGGTSVRIAGINHKPSATEPVVTVGGGAATGETATTTYTDCATPTGTAGARDVVLTNSDGETATLAGGWTYQAAGGGRGVQRWSNRLGGSFAKTRRAFQR